MAYGEIKIDTITFTAGGSDTSISVSGLVQNPTFTGNITTTGTISGDVIRGQTISGVTVTGSTSEFGTITGNTAGFTTVTGTTVTGTTANFVTVSGTTVTGDTGQFTNITGVNIVGTTQVSGATVTGNIGLFTSITGGTQTITSGIFASGIETNPSLTFVDDLNTGLYSPGADQVAISTGGSERLRITSDGKVGLGTSVPGALLNLAGTNTGSARNVVLRFNDTDSTVADGDIAGAIEFYSNDGGTSAETLILEARYNGTAGASDLFIRTGDKGSLSDDFVFTNGGRFGIGTTAPSKLFHLKGSQDLALFEATDAGATGAEITLQHTSTSPANNDTTSRINFAGLDAALNATTYSRIEGISTDVVNNQETGAIAFSTRSVGTFAERMRLTGTGLGIGTTAPVRNLHLASSGNNNVYLHFTHDGTGHTDADGADLRHNRSTDNLDIMNLENAGITFHTNGENERARIDSSGRLLVGISTARGNFFNSSGQETNFQIEGTGYGNSSAAFVRNSNTSGASYLILGKTRGTAVGANTIVNASDDLGVISFQGSDGSELVQAAEIKAVVDGTPGANSMPGGLIFSTTPTSSPTPVERARLTSAGALLVGTTSTPTNAASGAVVADTRLIIGSAGAGRDQRIVSSINTVTATTGTIVFKFKNPFSTSIQSCFVRLAVSLRANNATASNSPAAEYLFQLHNTATGVCSLNGATTDFEYTFVRATHFAFADLGSGECTVTLTNPTGQALTGSYRVEVLGNGGLWTLDGVSST